MKMILIAVLSVSIFSHAFAQSLPGTLPHAVERHSKYTFELDRGNKLIAYARTVQDLERFRNLDSVLLLFAKDYKLAQTTLSETPNSKVAVFRLLENQQHQLDLSEHPALRQRFQFRNDNDPLLIKTVQDTLVIVHTFLKPIINNTTTSHFNESLYFCLIVNQLDEVEALARQGGLNAKIQQALRDVQQYPHHNLQKTGFRYNLSYTALSNQPDFKTVETQHSPFLAIHPSVGVGVMRNQFVPNAMVDFSFVPNRYGMIGYTLGWRSLFFTDRNDLTQRLGTQTNSFVHAGITLYDFRRPQSKRINTDHVLFGVYVGRSVTRRGGIFDKNTWNLSMTIMAKGMVKIQPEVYFNGFFKNTMPGLRMQIGI